MTIDPIAMPTEKIAMTRLATRSSAVRMFFTSGGKMMISTAPIVQKKLIAQIDRNSRGICIRSEEHTSELQSLMRISYAVFCLKNKRHKNKNDSDDYTTIAPETYKQ